MRMKLKRGEREDERVKKEGRRKEERRKDR